MGGLIILEQIVEEEGPVIEADAAALEEAIAAEAEPLVQAAEKEAPVIEEAVASEGKALADKVETLAQEAEAEGKAVLDKLGEVFGEDGVGEVTAECEEASGPGAWEEASESMSDAAQKYQSQITGKSPGHVYRVGDVKFDGFADGILQDAKGPGYAKFVGADGSFKPWFRGANELLDQAERQIAAAGDTPIQWHVAEEPAADAIRSLFAEHGITTIKVISTPVLP